MISPRRPTNTSANPGRKPQTDLLSTQSIKLRDQTPRVRLPRERPQTRGATSPTQWPYAMNAFLKFAQLRQNQSSTKYEIFRNPRRYCAINKISKNNHPPLGGCISPIAKKYRKGYAKSPGDCCSSAASLRTQYFGTFGSISTDQA